MMPQNVLSTTKELGALLAPRDQRMEVDHLIDWEEGGININDGSEGLQVQTWTCTCDGTNFVLTSESDPDGTTVLTVAGGVTDMSFTFDQNMRVFVTYTLDDASLSYYWYDTTIPGYRTSVLPTGSLFARCTLDDKRPTQSSSSDIILAYTRASQLYFRMQRDRFSIEYQLTSSTISDSRLINIGISAVNRLQFNLTPP